jgi:hypothetical protein
VSLKLQWNDLFIEDLEPVTFSRWLDEWSWLLSGPVAPLFLSKFGDWFLRRPDGTTDMINVLDGTLEQVAVTPEEFLRNVNQREWQENYLLSELVFELHQRGKVPARGECYGFAPHPLFTGRLDVDLVMVMNLGAWQAICAQMARGAHGR